MVFWKRKVSAPAPASAPASPPLAPSRAATQTDFLSGDALEDRKSMKVLLEAIARVSESRNLDELLNYVVDRSIEVTGAERGLLVLIDDQDNQSIRVARDRSGRDIQEDIKYSRSIVGRVHEQDEPVRQTVQSDAEALELGASVFDLKLRAVMCVPLTPKNSTALSGQPARTAGAQAGALYVDSKAATREFKDEDLAMFAALSQHIAIALENARLNLQAIDKVRLERSLEIASEIQAGLMPKAPPTVPGWDCFGWNRPAEHATGDFYDFVRTRDGRLAVVVGDVTGHGIGPALITASAQASLRSYVKVVEDPIEVVSMLNQDLSERMDDGMFLCLFLALFGEGGKVQVINAGQTPPLIWRAETKTIERIKGSGPAVGMFDDFQYDGDTNYELNEGDALISFTDGLVEARHSNHPDRLFDEAGMRAVVSDRAAQAASAEELTRDIIQAVLEFCGGTIEDDMTIVTVRRTAT